MSPIVINHRTVIDWRDVHFSYVRATGPGGQHVNKVATAVQLRFNPARLPADVRARAIQLAGQRATKHGIIVMTSQRHRSQGRNRDAAIERLVALVRRATIAPTPRRRKKVSSATKRKRLEGKKTRSRTKQLRKPPPPE